MRFRVHFRGTALGAIGAQQSFTETVEADTAEAAVLKLYEKYEHITPGIITALPEVAQTCP